MILTNTRKIRKSERLVLTPLTLEELGQMADGSRNFLEESVLTETIHAAVLHKTEQMRLLPRDTHVWLTYWLILKQDSEKGIGLIGSKGLPDEDGYAELGYAIAKEHRGQGYLTEAMTEFLDWMYEWPFCSGAVLYIRKENHRSVRAAKRCGFLYEGMYGGYEVYRYVF